MKGKTMKYVKKMNIWDQDVQAGILAGQIKLQRGQWLMCGTVGRPCRYVGNNGRTIDVVHWQGSTSATNDLFKRRIDIANKYKTRKKL